MMLTRFALVILTFELQPTELVTLRDGTYTTNTTSGESNNFEKGAEDNLSAPSSFIANAHNEIYAFYTEKAAF